MSRLPARFESFSPLARAQYLEIVTFLEGYLLHAQGDRVLMGNSVEGRFPFLDYRVAEFAARLPDTLRLRGLREKYALRRAVERHLPVDIRSRRKVPYRAPIRDVFFGQHAPAYVAEALDAKRIADAGILDVAAVRRVISKFEQPRGVSETDEMALVGCVSVMLMHEQLIAKPSLAAPIEPSRLVIGDQVVADRWFERVMEA
jgi:asparagine synthase (glutamine-hydrolysing)